MTASRRFTFTAAVQEDTISELPDGVVADVRPVCAGAHRAIQGLRPPSAADLVHGLDVDIPAGHRIPRVATIHDTAVFDVPWAFPAFRARAERLLLARTVRRADALIAPSEFTADRIRSMFGREAVVTPLAAPGWAVEPDPDEVLRVRQEYGLPERFILQVGTAEPRKLTALLIRAAGDIDIPLVLAGSGSQRLTGPGVLGLGYVPTEHLPGLYRAASVTAYLSCYEGFGLPPLEAMSCGAAVLVSDIEPLRSVVGEGAERTPNRLTDVRGALADLVGDAQRIEELRTLGSLRALHFSWERTAALSESVYGGLL